MATPSVGKVGSFELVKLAGQGGMGVVWRAVHLGIDGGQTPVAVKLLANSERSTASYFDAFRREVQAVAALDHPHVVGVFDYGEVTEREAHAGLELSAGTPWLAMEFVGGGTLSRFRGKLDWSEIRSILLAILDALAHAHARGVIHRDLKPANVLMAPGRVARLADFGLAQFVRETKPGRVKEGCVTGTPHYMAPEQIETRWRDFGPWTDLYAVGCLTHALVAGRPPFAMWRKDVDAVLKAQRLQRPPRPVPVRPVPKELGEWLSWLLEKSESVRCRRAADAAAALLSLSPADSSLTPPRVERERRVSPDAQPATLTARVVTSSLGVGEETIPIPRISGEVSGGSEPNGRAPFSPSLLPEDWRGHDSRRRLHLLGAGLGLYGMRLLPVIGREPEQDLLWETFRRTYSTMQARLVVLNGASGCGKSRLAGWLGERAHELGGATLLRAVHSPHEGPLDGIGPMLAGHLRTAGLSRDETRLRVKSLLRVERDLPEGEVGATVELVRPATDAERAAGHSAVRFGRPAERYILLERWIRRLARERPVIVWLDDLQWGLDAMGFVEHLLDACQVVPAPVLVLATCRDGALAERPMASELLARLLQREVSLEVPIDALGESGRVELVESLLGLDEGLVEAVAERTAGNPLFAVQLVGDWVQRGLLVAGSDGFRTRGGAELPLPAGLHEVWSSRVERLLAGRVSSDSLALEIAAALGQDVDNGEWLDVCEIAGVSPSIDLLWTLIRARLVRRREYERGWSFTHGMLRESLERVAEERGRAEHHHSCCAAMLAGRSAPGDSARLGRHLVRAGRQDEALEPLLRGARHAEWRNDLGTAFRLLRERAVALDRLGVPQLDPRRIGAWGVWVGAARRSGKHEQADTWVGKMEAAAKATGDELLALRAQFLRGVSLQVAGRLEEAEVLLRDAVSRWPDRALDDRMRCLMRLGATLRMRGRLPEAEQMLRLAAGAESGDPTLAVDARSLHGAILHHCGCDDEARALLETARDAHETLGNRSGAAFSDNELGEIARRNGAWAEAEALYRSALRTFHATGSGNAISASVNLGLVRLERRDWDGATAVFEQAREEAVRRRQPHFECAAELCLLVTAAATRDWTRWDGHFGRGRQLQADTGFVDPDVARAASRAGEFALEVGDRERARRGFEIAVSQWRALGRTQEEQAVLLRLAEL